MGVFLLGFSGFVAGGWGEQCQLEGELLVQGSGRCEPGLCAARFALHTPCPLCSSLAPGRAGVKLRKLLCPAAVSLGHSWQGLGTVLVRVSSLLGSSCPRLAFTRNQTQCYTCPCSLQNISQHYALKTILKYSFICSTSYLVLSFFFFLTLLEQY